MENTNQPQVISTYNDQGIDTESSTQQALKDIQDKLATDELPFLKRAAIGGTNTGPGMFIMRRWVAADNEFDGYPDDPAFIKNLPTRILKDRPSAPDAEKEFLSASNNEYEYFRRSALLDQKAQDAKVIENSYVASGSQLAGDSAFDILAGMGVSRLAAKAATGAMRMAIGVGGNVGINVTSEALRQKAMIEDPNYAALGTAAASGAVFGAVFDGMTSASRRELMANAWGAAKGVFKRKPAGAIEAVEAATEDAAKVETKAAAKGVDPTAPKVKAEDPTVSPKGDVTEMVPVAKAPAHPLAANLVESSMQVVNREAEDMYYWMKHTGTDAQNQFVERTLQANAGDALVSVEKKVAPEVSAAADTAVVSQKGAKKVPEVDQFKTESQWMDFRAPDTYVPSHMKEIAAVERAVPDEVLQGRLRLKDQDTGLAIRPLFESPIDRSLAFVGSQLDDLAAAEAHLAVLRKAFPGATDDELVKIADDYVDNHLIPTHRLLKTGAPRMPRYWDTVNVEKFKPLDVDKVMAEGDFARWANNAPAGEAHVPLHEADVDGALRSQAVKEANELVSESHVRSGFRLVSTDSPLYGVSKLLKNYYDSFKLTAHAVPDAHTMRVFAAKQLYARKVFDKMVELGKDAGITPKFVAVTGTLAMTFGVTNANAGDGKVYASAALEMAMAAGGSILLGKAVFKSAIKKVGGWAKYDYKARHAAQLIKQGEADDVIKAKTGFDVVTRNGKRELYMTVKPEDFPGMTKGLASEELDRMAQGTFIRDAKGELKEVDLHVDHDRNIDTLNSIGQANYEKLVIKGKTVKLAGPLTDLRESFSILSDSKSTIFRGLNIETMSGAMTREGKEAVGNNADSIAHFVLVKMLGEFQDALRQEAKAFAKEPGAPRMGMPGTKKEAEFLDAWNAAIKRAHDEPLAKDLSPAAVRMKKFMSAQREQLIKDNKKVQEEFAAKGVELSPTSPVRGFASLENLEDYYKRMVKDTQFTSFNELLGPERFKAMLGRAYLNKNPGVSKELAGKIGESLHRGYRHMIGEKVAIVSDDVAKNLEDYLTQAGVPHEQIDDLLDGVGVHRVDNRPSVLKKRNALDMDVYEDVKLADGTVQRIYLRDLYETNMMDLHGSWVSQATGVFSYGVNGLRHGIDYSDDTVWNRLGAAGLEQGGTHEEFALLSAVRNQRMARGKDESILGNMGPIERTISAMTTLPLSAGFGIAQMGETFGLRASALGRWFMNLPEVVTLTKDVSGRSLDKGLAKDVAAMMGIGTDAVNARMASIGDTLADTAANKAERVTHTAMLLNGSQTMAAMSSHAVGADLLSTMVRYAYGEAIDPNFFKHMSAFGVDKKVADNMTEFLKRHAIFDKDDVLVGFDHSAAASDSMEKYMDLVMMQRRAANSANSTVSGIGETSKAERTSQAMRFFTKFMRTARVATRRTFKEGMNFDKGVAARWTQSFVGAALGTYLRIYLRYWNDEEELKKQLTPEAIALGGIRQANFSGLYTNLLDASFIALGMDPLTVAGSTASGRASGVEPAISTVTRRYVSTARAIKDAVTGAPGDRFTYREIMDAQSIMAPFLPAMVATSILAQDAPRKEGKKPKQQP